MQTATSDQQIAELRRELHYAKQQITRLQNELGAARAEARKRPEEQIQETRLPEPPPPQPSDPEWSAEQKAKASEAIARVRELESLLVHQQAKSSQHAAELEQAKARIDRLQSELRRKSPESEAPSTLELKGMRTKLEQAIAELEKEQEVRRGLQRRLSDKEKPSPRAVALEQLKGMPRSEEEDTSRKREVVIHKLNELGSQIGKLEKHKMNVEDALVAQVCMRIWSLILTPNFLFVSLHRIVCRWSLYKRESPT